MKNSNNDEKRDLAILKDMLDVLHGGICIADGEGIVLCLGNSCADIYGIDDSYIGKHLSVLEEEGIFSPCLSLIALKERRRVTMTQADKDGNPLLVTAAPIFDPVTKELLYAVSYSSWDVKNMIELQDRFEQLKKEMVRSNRELSALKEDLLDVKLVCESPSMQKLAGQAKKMSELDVELLIIGEVGSGKSYFARYVHALSARKDQPFGQMSCSAFSCEILNDELFGYVKINPVTGEEVEKAGLCEVLHNGTLLLEDIDSLDSETQNKLLYLLKNKKYYKHKGSSAVASDIRILATTQNDVQTMAQTMNPDLFYLISMMMLEIPSLKSRKEDIPVLVDIFLKKYNEKYKKSLQISSAAISALNAYTWVGNVMELKCLIQQLVLTVDEKIIQVHHLPDYISPFSSSGFTAVVDLKEYLDYYEGKLVLLAYEKCKTTVKLAKYLGISQATAVRKLQKYQKEK